MSTPDSRIFGEIQIKLVFIAILNSLFKQERTGVTLPVLAPIFAPCVAGSCTNRKIYIVHSQKYVKKLDLPCTCTKALHSYFCNLMKYVSLETLLVVLQLMTTADILSSYFILTIYVYMYTS